MRSLGYAQIAPMKPTKTLPQLFIALWGHINEVRKYQFIGAIVLMVLASFVEVLSIGALVPFLGVLTSPGKVYEQLSGLGITRSFGITTSQELLLPLCLIFTILIFLNGSLRLILLWLTNRLACLIGADMSIKMYRRALYQPYEVHVSQNSSQMVSAVSSKTGIAIHVVMMTINLISSIFILIGIMIALLIINIEIALTIGFSFGLIYFFISASLRRSLKRNSILVANGFTQVIKILQEGLGGIRDVLIGNLQEIYCKKFQDFDQSARLAQASSGFLAASPRYLVEVLAIWVITGIAYVMAHKPEGLALTIPILGAFALGAQRLLPMLQQSYSSLVNIRASHASLEDALNLLGCPSLKMKSDFKKIDFKSVIHLRNISFKYSVEMPLVLDKVDLRIEKGSRLGFIGVTGCGKSTLLDIVMGLLTPTIGNLEVDGVKIRRDNQTSWQQHIAHVPQSVFLIDATIAENIALGCPKQAIDMDRVRDCCQKAQLSIDIESWPKGYDTMVGERGVRLSGGQRQRIGIARAMYRNADVLVMDESTSALDDITESAIMDAVNKLDSDLTVLIIAHRKSSLRDCDQIYELEKGNIKWFGNYDQLRQRD